VGDDVVHPGPLRAPVKFLEGDVPPGSRRAQALRDPGNEGSQELAPTMMEEGGDEGSAAALRGTAGLLGPLGWRKPRPLAARPNGVAPSRR